MGIELIRENGFDLGLITFVTQKRLTDYGQLESKNAPERIMISFSPRSQSHCVSNAQIPGTEIKHVSNLLTALTVHYPILTVNLIFK